MEEWKEIKGFEGVYAVSNYGNVKRLEHYKRCGEKGQTFLEERIVRQYKNFRGYYRVHLSRRGKNHMRFVHRLVAEAFIPNDEKKPQVNHIDGNKENNNVTNLEWVTNQENNIHAFDIGLKQGKKVVIVETNEVFNSISSCARAINGSYSMISRCLNGYTNKPYRGCHFKLLEERSE